MNMLYEGLKEKGALMLIPSARSRRWVWVECSVRPHSVRIGWSVATTNEDEEE